MVFKRHVRACGTEGDGSCGESASLLSKRKVADELRRKVCRILDDQKAIVSKDEQRRFAEFVDRSMRYREMVAKRWTEDRLRGDDIIRLIQIARDSGDMDEAFWRSFLAAHFGRPSADATISNQVETASLFLFAFGKEPVWTWVQVSNDPNSFRDWLHKNANKLKVLSFGNHRKYESKQAKGIWQVTESFLALVEHYRSPLLLFTPAPTHTDPRDVFDALYHRLIPLKRFGRTGVFDFLELLINLDLVSALPKSCYLNGATGPKLGAERLWGKRPIGELDRVATELAVKLGLSPAIVEDALCNWQK